jgi:hypothetical protein
MRTSRHNIIVISIAAVTCAGIYFTGRSLTEGRGQSPKQKFSSRVFRVAEKWGYEILVNDSLFIRQETIPALGGNGFDSPEQATQTAALIINKMKSGRHPTVTTFEIRQICAQNKQPHDDKGEH